MAFGRYPLIVFVGRGGSSELCIAGLNHELTRPR
jgi:hypothetical protein